MAVGLPYLHFVGWLESDWQAPKDKKMRAMTEGYKKVGEKRFSMILLNNNTIGNQWIM